MKKIIFIYLLSLSFLSSNLVSQNFGLRVGVTTATPTGNNDAFELDFFESFSPGYKAGLFGNFELSDVIILKPEISYREYTVKQEEIDWGTAIVYDIEQKHSTFSGDLNFDIKLTYFLSLIFGVGLDYISGITISNYLNDFEETTEQDLSDMSSDQRLDPFSNIGLCFKIGRTILVDLEYRHLLDNWGTGNLSTGNQLISSENGSVKLHMINLSLGVVF